MPSRQMSLRDDFVKRAFSRQERDFINHILLHSINEFMLQEDISKARAEREDTLLRAACKANDIEIPVDYEPLLSLKDAFVQETLGFDGMARIQVEKLDRIFDAPEFSGEELRAYRMRKEDEAIRDFLAVRHIPVPQGY